MPVSGIPMPCPGAWSAAGMAPLPADLEKKLSAGFTRRLIAIFAEADWRDTWADLVGPHPLATTPGKLGSGPHLWAPLPIAPLIWSPAVTVTAIAGTPTCPTWKQACLAAQIPPDRGAAGVETLAVGNCSPQLLLVPSAERVAQTGPAEDGFHGPSQLTALDPKGPKFTCRQNPTKETDVHP